MNEREASLRAEETLARICSERETNSLRLLRQEADGLERSPISEDREEAIGLRSLIKELER